MYFYPSWVWGDTQAQHYFLLFKLNNVLDPPWRVFIYIVCFIVSPLFKNLFVCIPLYIGLCSLRNRVELPFSIVLTHSTRPDWQSTQLQKMTISSWTCYTWEANLVVHEKITSKIARGWFQLTSTRMLLAGQCPKWHHNGIIKGSIMWRLQQNPLYRLIMGFRGHILLNWIILFSPSLSVSILQHWYRRSIYSKTSIAKWTH
jgi:hypothetical protein